MSALRSFAEFQRALRQEFAAFQVEKDGVLYDIGIGEGGELVCAWRASDPEEARAVKRLGNTSPWTGIPDPDVAYRLAEWLGVEVPQNG